MKKIGLLIMLYGIICMSLFVVVVPLSIPLENKEENLSDFFFTSYTVIWRNGTETNGYIMAPLNTTIREMLDFVEGQGDWVWASIP